MDATMLGILFIATFVIGWAASWKSADEHRLAKKPVPIEKDRFENQ